MMKILLVCFVFLAVAYAGPAPPAQHGQVAYAASAPSAQHGQEAYIFNEPIGFEQPGFDRYSYGYGTPEYVGTGGLIEKPVHYNIGRQGIGFDKRTAFAYGFRMPLTNNIIRVLRRYPEKESHVKA